MFNSNDCSEVQISDNSLVPVPETQGDNYDFLSGPCKSEHHQGLEDALKGLPLEGSRSQAYLDGYFSLGGNEVTSNPIATLRDAWL